MKPPESEQEEKAGPGAAARKAALGVVDAFLEFFQRQHNRLAGSDEREERHGHGRKQHAQHEPETAAVPARPSLLRRLAIGLLLLLAGLGAGGFLAYRTFSLKLNEHNSVVERMQEELDAVRKEDARNVKLLDKFQRENAEYRREAREAQHEAEAADRRAAELEAQLEDLKAAETKRVEDAKRAEEAAQSARRSAEMARQRPVKQQRTPQKTGNCAAGTAAEMAACIEKFNQP
jgi:hypothetical protein